MGVINFEEMGYDENRTGYKFSRSNIYYDPAGNLLGFEEAGVDENGTRTITMTILNPQAFRFIGPDGKEWVLCPRRCCQE